MNNCAKINEKYAILLADRDEFLRRHTEFKRAKTADAKKQLWDLMKSIQTTEAELRKDGDPNLVELRKEIASRYGARFASGFQKNMAYAEFADGSRILVNKNGEKIVDEVFMKGMILSVNEGIAVISDINKDFCIKDDGTVLNLRQARVRPSSKFTEGLLVVDRNIGGFSLYAFMDTDGKMHPKKTDNWYRAASVFSNGYACVCPQQGRGNYNYIDETGAVFDKLGHREFRRAEAFSENSAAVVLSGERGWRYMNTEGEIISGDYEFQEAGYFKNGMAIVRMHDRYGYFTADGRLLPENGFAWFAEMPAEFSDGYGLIITADEEFRYMDKAGNFYPPMELPPLIYAQSFSEGLAFAMYKDGTTGYVNTEFKLVIDCESGGQFKDGVANAFIDGSMGYIDKYGNKVF